MTTPTQMAMQLDGIETEIETLKSFIKRKEVLDRLRKNKDFQEIIMEGYFEKESKRLVMLKGDVNSDKETEEDCDKLIVGVGSLHRYFQTVEILGNSAKHQLEAAEQTKEELLEEQLGVE